MSENYLLLKWGTVKGWSFNDTDSEVFKIFKKYMEGSTTLGCMTDHPNEDRKKLLCDVIEKFDGEIQNDWDGEFYTKEKAKDYIMNY